MFARDANAHHEQTLVTAAAFSKLGAEERFESGVETNEVKASKLGQLIVFRTGHAHAEMIEERAFAIFDGVYVKVLEVSCSLEPEVAHRFNCSAP